MKLNPLDKVIIAIGMALVLVWLFIGLVLHLASNEREL